MSLSDHLWNISGGTIYERAEECADTTAPGDIIAQPSSGKRLAITHICVAHDAPARFANIRHYESDGTTKVADLFLNLTHTFAILSVNFMDFSDCPIVLPVDHMLKCDTNAGTISVTVRGYEI